MDTKISKSWALASKSFYVCGREASKHDIILSDNGYKELWKLERGWFFLPQRTAWERCQSEGDLIWDSEGVGGGAE